MNISKIVISSIIILLLDFIYLGSHSQYFKKVFTKIQGKSIIRYSAALLCYIAMITFRYIIYKNIQNHHLKKFYQVHSYSDS